MNPITRFILKGSLFKRIFISVTFLLIFSLSVSGFVIYFNSSRLINEKVHGINMGYLHQKESLVNQTLHELVGVSDYILKDIKVNEILYHGASGYEKLDNRNYVFNLFDKIGYINNEIETIVFSTRYQEFNNSDYVLDQEQLRDINPRDYSYYAGKQQGILRPIFSDTILKKKVTADQVDSPQQHFTFVKQVVQEGQWLGSIIIVLKHDFFAATSQDGLGLYILDENGVIWNEQKDQTDSSFEQAWMGKTSGPEGTFLYTLEGQSDQYYFITSSLTGWKYVLAVSPKDIFRDIRQIGKYVFLTIIVCILLSLAATAYIARKLTQPIHQLAEEFSELHMERMGKDYKAPGEKLSGIHFRRNLIVFFVIIILLPNILFIGTAYRFTLRSIQVRLLEYSSNIFQFSASTIQAAVNKYYKMSDQIAYRYDIQEILSQDTGNGGLDGQPGLRQGVLNDYILENGVQQILLYRDNWELLYNSLGSRYGLGSQSSYKGHLILSMNRSYTNTLLTSAVNELTSKPSMVLASKIKGYLNKNYLSSLGYLFLYIDESSLEEVFRGSSFGFGQNVKIYITNGDKVIQGDSSKFQGSDFTSALSLKNSASGYKVLKDNQDGEYFAFYKKLDQEKLGFWVLVPSKEITGEMNKLLLNSFFALEHILLLSIIVALQISSMIVRPIQKTRETMSRASEYGELSLVEKEYQISEVDQLRRSFNAMVKRIHHLINQVYKAEIKEKNLLYQKKEAELNILQAQIKPHFLYNTLESIKWMIKLNENQQAADMVTQLGLMLRMGVRNDEVFVSIEEEIKHLKAYLMIQRVRYDDLFDVSWFIDETIYSLDTVRFILQPITENAIQHGLETKQEKGHIWIRGYRRGNDVYFEIEDDGVGMTYEELAVVEKLLSEAHPAEKVGICNVNKRIKLYYGEQYGIEVWSQWGRGTKVVVHIPAVMDHSIQIVDLGGG